MRACSNMHNINTNNFVIQTHTDASCTSTYDNIRLICYEYIQTKNGKARKYTTICGEITVNVWLCGINFGK